MAASIPALLHPRCYPHPVGEVRLIETHISWLLLTGRYAYKIKKPVDLGFANFSTLALRERYCREEVRLNRRFAPDLYLDVVPVTGTPEVPTFGGSGAPIEFAVRMREFPQDDLLDRRLAAGRLQPEHVDALADACADFHDRADIAPAASPHADPATLLEQALANFSVIDDVRIDGIHRDRIAALKAWTIAEHARIVPALMQRRIEGRIRECHGDLHLGNIALVDERVTLFDCIEFNASLRWIDVMNELAFAVMDLASRGRPDYAHRLLDRYLSASGDYQGLAVLRFYLVYRALVRAKVDCIHAAQAGSAKAAGSGQPHDPRHRIELAEALAQPGHPLLAITCGVSGSGKTHLSQIALERIGAVRIRSDVERKRLHGLKPAEQSGSAPDAGIYGEDASERTFARLAALARIAIDAGWPVIVDATFLLHERRRQFADLAAAAAVPFVILHCRADAALLEARIAQRKAIASDASEAGIEILRRQQQHAEPLDSAEQRAALLIDGRNAASIDAAIDRLSAIGRTA